jgi:hypothetical protein
MYSLLRNIRYSIILLLAIFTLNSVNLEVSAQNRASAEISNLSCEGLGSSVQYTFTLEVTNASGYEIRVGVWPRYSSDDEFITFSGRRADNNYSDTAGYITSQDVVTARYTSTLWEPFTLSIPTSVFPADNYSFYRWACNRKS